MNWSWLLPESFSTFGPEIDRIYYVILWITAVVFFLTEGMLLYFVVRFRHKDGGRAAFHHGSTRLEVAWTTVPLVIVVGLGLMSKGVWDRVKRDVPDGALEVIVAARQFEWHVTYPGEDGILGGADDFTMRNQLHVPLDRPVVVNLRSDDVLHSFFLPELRVKQDAVPGKNIRVWFQATAPGEYTLGCAELCGTGHTTMSGTLTVHAPDDYQTWLRSQSGQR